MINFYWMLEAISEPTLELLVLGLVEKSDEQVF